MSALVEKLAADKSAEDSGAADVRKSLPVDETRCISCGAMNGDQLTFCGKCGAALRKCPKCGKANEARLRFCGHCGRPFF
jgi:membrane protease subunit (stomatin/prohibitin family)